MAINRCSCGKKIARNLTRCPVCREGADSIFGDHVMMDYAEAVLSMIIRSCKTIARHRDRITSRAAGGTLEEIGEKGGVSRQAIFASIKRLAVG